ncbi:MAG TPA: hypothetical protein DCX12_05355, partial [Chloroflexi bacterium]|nr:hypothetical protein [Chloroflexota bacterium]
MATLLAACGGTTGHPASPSHSPSPAPTATPSPTAAITPVPAAADAWPVYHQNQQRTGQSPNTPALTSLATKWSAQLDGAVWAEPIVVGDNVIVATENDTLYALNPLTGGVVWQDHVGTPVPQADLPCGNIFPLGMTGTPAYDAATQSIFVVA